MEPCRACRRGKWYNMQQIDMSKEKPMDSAGNSPQMRYSAAYPTGRELGTKVASLVCVSIVFSLCED